MSLSFTKFINNAMPNLAADPHQFDSLPNTGQDMLFTYQISQSNPYALRHDSFYVGGVVENEKMSEKAFKALQKNDVLNDIGIVDTTKIGPKFTGQMAFLPQNRQKILINLLFWWKEECVRLARLMGQEEQLVQRVQALERGSEGEVKGEIEELKMEIDRVKARIGQKPSERGVDSQGNAVTDPPAYQP
ncbi:hypothetical protein H2198_009066 [Neophaeococcomyces mojaviensis]|uniref:Uncharacterized protein n=1 Tax=Neophaeococcomyces mojaviensis TaxID=3383035 RepID=A0ACC2ZVE3_9EURO|nr:hypothetical protein H2198_009066 [Knufia sp. JES_112]